MPYRPRPRRSPNRVLPPKRSAWRSVAWSIPQPLSSTETSIAFSSSSLALAATEMEMRVAPAWIELSTSSEIALAVPLYPESRVAWMNLSSAMIDAKSRRTACAAFLMTPLASAGSFRGTTHPPSVPPPERRRLGEVVASPRARGGSGVRRSGGASRGAARRCGSSGPLPSSRRWDRLLAQPRILDHFKDAAPEER